MTKLIIVESPAKVRTIEKYLGADYRVLATIGHIRELPKKDAIDPANDYAMTYVTIPGKEDVIKKITSSLKDCDEIILATDPDREGEAIAWHVADLLETKHAKKIEGKKISRAVFYEISKNAVIEAISESGEIAMDLVLSQETRRALDRHFGFTISPLLWRLFPSNNHSAGRVQSPALRMIVEREKEIEAFIPDEYWYISAELKTDEHFETKLKSFEGEKVKKFTFSSNTHVEGVTSKLESSLKKGLTAVSVNTKNISRNPKAPFKTSSFEGVASGRFGITPKKAMQIAQVLYENAHITYMRTDSTDIESTKLPSIYKKIISLYGEDFLDDKKVTSLNEKHTNQLSNQNKKKTANKQAIKIQGGHPALTPTDINKEPNFIRKELELVKKGKLEITAEEQLKIYSLIWLRTIASQMKPYTQKETSIEFSPTCNLGLAILSYSSRQLIFPGYLAATKEEVQNKVPLKISENDEVEFIKLIKEQHFTDPPPRYNDASMIKTLEEKGIGRPSTYADILSKLTERGYVTRKQKSYQPSDMGRLVGDFLNKSFEEYISDEFTSNMENDLDAVSNGTKSKKEVLDLFWSPLEEEVVKTGEKVTRRDVNPPRLLGTDPETNKPIFARMTKNGPAVQKGDIDAGDDPEWGALKEGQKLFSITLEDALGLFKKDDNILGTHPETSEPIIVRETRYGPVVQLGSGDDGKKPKYVSLIKGENMEDVGLERALQYLSLPRDIGKDPESGETILATMGPYGPYLKRGSQNFSLRKGCDPFTVDLTEALASIASKKGSTNIKEFENSGIKIKEGRWGPYITNGKLNASVPKNTDPETLSEEDCLALLDAKQKKNKSKKKKNG